MSQPSTRHGRAVGAYCRALLPPLEAATAAAAVLASVGAEVDDDELLRRTRDHAVARVSVSIQDSRGDRRGRTRSPSEDAAEVCELATLPSPFGAGGELDPGRLATIAQHVRSCPRCRLIARLVAAEEAFAAALARS